MRLGIPSAQSGTNFTLPDLPQPQRIAVGVLAILALAIIIFWVWQMQAQIYSPFAYNGPPSTLGASVATSSPSLDLLKKTDTDGDGLSDYAEIYVYHTSPYLADTNSDGLTDLQDIEQGKDPVCPAGQNCNGATPAASSSAPAATTDTSATTGLIPMITPSASSSSSSSASLGAGSVDQTALQAVLNGQADAATLRQVLLASGIATQAELNTISDADLLKSYQATLNSQASSTNLNPLTSTSSSPTSTAQ